MDFPGNGRIIEMLEAADAMRKHCGRNQGEPEGIILAWGQAEQNENQAMTKSLEVISEVIRNPKHPFRKVENQPKKPQKHRYERRKIRAYLQLGEWSAGEAM